MTILYPESESEWLALRHKHVSSTESAPLFGLGSYQTPYELAISKQESEPPRFDQTDRMKWGLRAQEMIAKGISEDYGVKVRRINGYATHPTSRLGASFDYEIVGLREDITPTDTILQGMYNDCGPGILEIKNVDRLIFRRDWKSEDGMLEAPPQFEIQVQHQMEAIQTRKWACIGAFVGGNDTQLLIREQDTDFGKMICQKVDKFWADLGQGILPPVTLPADIEVIRRIYLAATPGKVYDGAQDEELTTLVSNFDLVRAQIKELEAAQKSAQARILMKIGDAELATAPGFRISATTVAEAEIPAYTRKAYRLMRVTPIKPKENQNGK